jgi:hypothetical protein
LPREPVTIPARLCRRSRLETLRSSCRIGTRVS